MQAASAESRYALTYVYGEKETIVAALPIEIALAVELFLKQEHPNREVRYNAWTRLHLILLEGAIYMVFPFLIDGQHAEVPLARPIQAEEGNLFSRLCSLPVEPITGVTVHDDKVLGSILRGRSAATEAAMRAVELDDIGSTPEHVWIDTAEGWKGVTGNLMLGVWLRRRGSEWGIVTPTGTGAVAPEGDLYEAYKRTMNTFT